jgi:hypothetical protein
VGPGAGLEWTGLIFTIVQSFLCHEVLAFLLAFLTVPPVPSHASWACDFAKKCHQHPYLRSLL